MIKKEIEKITEVVANFLSGILIEEYGILFETKAAYWNFEYNNYKSKKIFQSQVIEISLLIEEVEKKLVTLDYFITFSQNDCFDYTSSDINFKKWSKVEILKKNIAKQEKLIIKVDEFKDLIKYQLDVDTELILLNIQKKHKELIKQLKKSKIT